VRGKPDRVSDGLVEEERLLQGRYRLVAPIARGGMAEVWEGVDEVLTRPIAVKLLHRHLAADESFRARFRREAVAAARLAHPNVVATFDTGDDDDVPFIVMELVRGRTLRALINDGPLPPPVAAAIAIQVGDALAAAHRAGLIHRDVKPGNVLLCAGVPVGSPASVKVADFGIARAATATTDIADLTQPGTLLGTTKYLAPEQVQGGEPDARSDVYALGVVLYEMVTGRAPFAADTAVATAMAHVNNEPVRPRHVRAGIPRSLEHVVLRAMAKDPDARYQSAEEFVAALRSIDLGTDDAVPLVVRDPTPPAGHPGAFQDSERTWIVPAVIIVGAAAALIALALVLGGSDVGRDLINRDDPAAGDPGQTIPIANVGVLDPAGNGEKNDRLGFVIDDQDTTSWQTDRYNTPEFGGLKDHLGLQLDLGAEHEVGSVTVTSPTSGWSAEIYVSDTPSDDVAQWGERVAVQDSISGSATFEGIEASGRYVLVLFTRLGSDNRVEVQRVTVAG
jgi:eukaryotic-like serine/threonine-protein kinase